MNRMRIMTRSLARVLIQDTTTVHSYRIPRPLLVLQTNSAICDNRPRRRFSSTTVPPNTTTKPTQTSVYVHEHTLSESKADKERKQRRALARSQIDPGTGGLIEQTLKELDKEDPSVRRLTPEERKEKRRSLEGTPSFDAFVGEPLKRKTTTIFQVNIGLYCNQACSHCHVESSPRRLKEQMDRQTVDRCLEIIQNSPSIGTVDITGGAPELNQNFRYLVQSIRNNFGNRGRQMDIIDRCNLTVLSEPGQEDLADFLAKHKVHVVASLPCYGAKNVDQQRGNGVFDKSIAALLKLNDLGYGTDGTGLNLDLVYNPIGPFLPPDQSKLEVQYKKELDDKFGIQFNKLFCITNMPIKRFADFLHRRGELKDYMDLLVRSFNPSTVDSVMCRDTISVRYDGALFDCDFNQQLGMALHGAVGEDARMKKMTVFDLQSTEELTNRKIATGPHCFGCTAGRGSSCQGVVA